MLLLKNYDRDSGYKDLYASSLATDLVHSSTLGIEHRLDHGLKGSYTRKRTDLVIVPNHV